MKLGTVRIEEARVYDSHAGYHQFHADETQEPYGSFEVFWQEPGYAESGHSDDELAPGWYWWAVSPGCMPDSDQSGPFAYSQQAHQDADEWAPEYDED
jgi:hypothetical protein